ncbi:MFS transporter [Nocardia seriolae]|uniref:alpha-amylase n=1 Tax=Nocardia seriolae TaxID=37332 RepID=A0ABC8AR17_9NOCA|nr:MFS transporter [Nocardia seriolae]APA96571.1 Multidrug resistance protein [Nocardia seriolae]OJF78916.1 MFS transporter [Nocardia seriolae]PSK30691.1 MFS transporter [Nocardia seriolae]QOW30842.1 MFS transporter [Nocardia seriolae]QUN15225.1 MFS transporter [Nocardia seriolae]
MTNSSTQTKVAAPVRIERTLSHRQIMTILSGLLLGVFLAALDQNIVSVAIVRIANSLHGFDKQAWATTAYLITATISTPLYGKLADIYGRKSCYLIAIGVFVIGSVACTFATSMYQLAGFRALQGVGAGGLMSLAFTIIGDIVPPRERVRYQGYFMMVFGIATVLGPVLGGFFSNADRILGLSGWRWVFLVNVPIGVLALLVVGKVLDVPFERHRQRTDWLGAITLAAGTVPLLVIAQQGREWGWQSHRALLCYAVAAAGLVLFLIVELLMRDAALIPLRLFRKPTFSIAILGGFIVGVAMFGAIMLVPLYFQVVRGYSPTRSGLFMLPLVLGIMLGAQLSGLITKFTGRYKALPILGSLVIGFGSVLFALVRFDSPLWQPLLYCGVIGFGLGGCMQTLIIAAQNAGPRADMGVSTAAATFFRQMGGTLGVAVFLTILFNLLPRKIIAAFGGQLPPGFDAGRLGRIQSNTGDIAALPAELRTPILTGFTHAMSGVFYVAAAVAVLAALVLLFMKEIPLQDVPAPVVEEIAEPEPEPDFHFVEPSGLSVSGCVRREDGQSVPDAVLTLIDQRGRQVSRAVGEPDGGYLIGVPRAGGYVLIVSAFGYQPAAVSLSVGSRPHQLDVSLLGSGEVSGTVRAVGAPLRDATVTLTDAFGDVVGSAITTAEGDFTCRGVLAGTYTLVAVAEHMRPAAVTLTVPDSGMLRHDIDLAPRAVLAGSACNERGDGVPDAQITVLDEAGDLIAVTRTDDTGRYVVPDLAEGRYTVMARGYPAAFSRVTVADGEVAHDVLLGYERVESLERVES